MTKVFWIRKEGDFAEQREKKAGQQKLSAVIRESCKKELARKLLSLVHHQRIISYSETLAKRINAVLYL